MTADIHLAGCAVLHSGGCVLSSADCDEITQSNINTGIFIIVVTPARIAQFVYDQARILASTRFGWLALGTAISV